MKNFSICTFLTCLFHDDVIKWKHFPRYWPFVRGIHRPPVNSQHKGQWPGAFMFSLICAWINRWVNNREAGDLRRYRAHYDVIVMSTYVYDNGPRVYNTCQELCTIIYICVYVYVFIHICIYSMFSCTIFISICRGWPSSIKLPMIALAILDPICIELNRNNS